MGDHDAQHRREHDAVTRGEHRGRGPKGYRRSDERIREDVSDRLTDDSWLDAQSIEVAVKDGDVTLTGMVRSREDKKRAEALAESVSGVDNVQNSLRLARAADTPSTTVPLSDPG
jgi:osmotically-inducible protein OsmY